MRDEEQEFFLKKNDNGNGNRVEVPNSQPSPHEESASSVDLGSGNESSSLMESQRATKVEPQIKELVVGLLTHSDILPDEVITSLRNLLDPSASDEQVTSGLAVLEEVIAAIQEANIDAILATLHPVLITWYKMPDWILSRSWLTAHLTELPADAHTQLKRAAKGARGVDEDLAERLDLYARLLIKSRRTSINAAYQALVGNQAFENEGTGRDVNFDGLMQQIKEWITASSWDNSLAHLHAHPDLLTNSARLLLERLEDFQPGEHAHTIIELHQRLQRLAQEHGIDEAYKRLLSALQDELETLLTELKSLFDQGVHLVRQAELCQYILYLDRMLDALPASLQGAVFMILGDALHELAGQRGAGEELLGKAIASYNLALEIYDPISWPLEHARMQQNKAGALIQLATRLGGEEGGQLLEQAITCFDAALEIRNYTSRPSDFAMIQTNKGSALLQLAELYGEVEGAELLKRSITCYDSALTIYSRTSWPLQYTIAQTNKGSAIMRLAELGSETEAEQMLEQAIACFDIALEACDRMSQPSQYASIQQNKGTAFQSLAKLRGGEEGTQLLKQALACHDIALEIRDRTSMPLAHAKTQHNKGNTLAQLAQHRSGEEGEQLLKQAITCFDIALEIYGRTRMTSDYARTQREKGYVLVQFSKRVADEEGAELLKQAIDCYDAALKIFTRAGMPLNHAKILHNKGDTLRFLAERRNGEEAIQLFEQAIACFDMALEIHDRFSVPLDHAMTQSVKANVLADLAEQRERAGAIRLLEQAVACCDIALEIFDYRSTPFEYSTAIQNKGNVFVRLAERCKGVEAIRLLEQALLCYDVALILRDRNRMPSDHAMTQHNKGNALLELADFGGQTEKIRRLNEAITCYDIALEIYDRLGMFPNYAGTLIGKGTALKKLASEYQGVEAVTLLEQAILNCDLALKISDQNGTTPLYVAGQVNKGIALYELAELRSGAEKAQLLETAGICFNIALSLSPRAIMPQQHLARASTVAQIYLILALMQSDTALLLEKAWNIAASGLEAARILERLAPSLEFRQNEWVENAQLYAVAGTIQALRGAVGEAVDLLETGRARGLSQALRRQNIDLSLLSIVEKEEYDTAVNALLEIEARGRQRADFRRALALVAEAEIANSNLAKVVEKLRKVHPAFLFENRLNAETLARNLHQNEVLIYLIPQYKGTLLVFVSSAEKPRAEWLSDLMKNDSSDLVQQDDIRNDVIGDYFLSALGLESTPLDKALDHLLPALGERLMRRVVQKAREIGAQRAVLVAGGLLAGLPLHAATYQPLDTLDIPTAPNGQRYACDDLLITYTPSGTAYVAARRAADRKTELHHGFVAGNSKLTLADEPRWEPGMPGYLPYALEEVERVADVMSAAGMTVTCRTGEFATWRAIIEGLREADLAHLAIHAIFDPLEPLASALLVAPKAKLFLRDLLDPRLVSLDHLRLAVLSSCQSGLVDLYHLREEAIGLFGALLSGGAAGVIGSLWPVYDYSTKLLMEAFTQRYLQKHQEPDMALRNAIRWLRGLPDELPVGDDKSIDSFKQVEKGAEEVTAQHAIAELQWKERCVEEPVMVRQLSYRSDDEQENLVVAGVYKPLEHPIHWAAFVYYGA